MEVVERLVWFVLYVFSCSVEGGWGCEGGVGFCLGADLGLRDLKKPILDFGSG